MTQTKHSFAILTEDGVRVSGGLNISFACLACGQTVVGLFRLSGDGTFILYLAQDYHQPKLSLHKLSAEVTQCGNASILCECFACPAPPVSTQPKSDSLSHTGTSFSSEKSRLDDKRAQQKIDMAEWRVKK